MFEKSVMLFTSPLQLKHCKICLVLHQIVRLMTCMIHVCTCSLITNELSKSELDDLIQAFGSVIMVKEKQLNGYLEGSLSNLSHSIQSHLPQRQRPVAYAGFGRGGGGVSTRDPHTFSKGVRERAVSSPIGVWGGGPAALQLSLFVSYKT